jgi:hypothetical protein
VTEEIKVYECDQNSEEWYSLRAGIPTASEYESLVKRLRNGDSSKDRQTLIYKKAAERILGKPLETATSRDMARGHEMEPEARAAYSLVTGAELTRVGFIRRGETGCSPDSLIANDGVLEVKTKAPHLLVECFALDEFPAEHKAQCQGILMNTDREWVDLCAYWPDMPLFVMRARRDEDYIANLRGEVARFNDDVAALVEKIRKQTGLED